METSAREMVNVEETFALIVRRVVEARLRHAHGGELPMTNPGVVLGPQLAWSGGEKNAAMTADPAAMQSRRAAQSRSFLARLKCW